MGAWGSGALTCSWGLSCMELLRNQVINWSSLQISVLILENVWRVALSILCRTARHSSDGLGHGSRTRSKQPHVRTGSCTCTASHIHYLRICVLEQRTTQPCVEIRSAFRPLP